MNGSCLGSFTHFKMLVLFSTNPPLHQKPIMPIGAVILAIQPTSAIAESCFRKVSGSFIKMSILFTSEEKHAKSIH